MSQDVMNAFKVTVQDGKACEKVLKIEVPNEEITREYDAFYKAIAPKAKIPGFRPGKAPRHVLEMHYGHDARSRVLENLISESYRHALQDKSLQPLGYPAIEKVDFKDNRLRYEAKVEVRPKIKLSRVTGLTAKKETIPVKNEEVEETLKRVQQAHAQFKAVEDRPARKGDYLIADYVCSVEGKEIDKRADDWFEIREEEYLKGFSVQLIGVKAGEEKEFRIQLPENFGLKDAAGKEAVFQVKVKEVKEKSLPPLDDNLAREAGEFKTLEELKKRIEEDIRGNHERQEEAQFERALLDELVKQNKIDLPAGLVARRLEHLVNQALEYQQKMQADGNVEELKKKLSKDLEGEARRQIHIAFLLDEISGRENLRVEDADIQARMQAVADQVRQPVETVKKYYGSNEDAMHSLIDQIRNEKAIEFVKKNAKQK